MREKALKITLEELLEVLLNHGMSIQKIEEIMAELGVQRHYLERALANVMTIFPRQDASSSNLKRAEVNFDVISQLREIKDMIEKMCNRLSSANTN